MELEGSLITEALNYKVTFGETWISVPVDLKQIKGLITDYISNTHLKRKDSSVISIYL